MTNRIVIVSYQLNWDRIPGKHFKQDWSEQCGELLEIRASGLPMV